MREKLERIRRELVDFQAIGAEVDDCLLEAIVFFFLHLTLKMCHYKPQELLIDSGN